ncbi:MAG TPA: hypothetical protein VF559_11660 [Caulobacteraceae bacterium]
MKRKAPDRKKQAQRAALNALRKARRLAERAGVKLSEWEGEFLGSVEGRVKTYGRAFGDPEKGGAGEALSTLQTVKLKEIAAKAKGEPPRKPRFRRRSPAS